MKKNNTKKRQRGGLYKLDERIDAFINNYEPTYILYGGEFSTKVFTNPADPIAQKRIEDLITNTVLYSKTRIIQSSLLAMFKTAFVWGQGIAYKPIVNDSTPKNLIPALGTALVFSTGNSALFADGPNALARTAIINMLNKYAEYNGKDIKKPLISYPHLWDDVDLFNGTERLDDARGITHYNRDDFLNTHPLPADLTFGKKVLNLEGINNVEILTEEELTELKDQVTEEQPKQTEQPENSEITVSTVKHLPDLEGEIDSTIKEAKEEAKEEIKAGTNNGGKSKKRKTRKLRKTRR